MFAVQLWLLAASKSTIRIKRRFPYTDIEVLGLFVYLYILTIQLVILILCQFEIGDNPIYVETIGFLGVALEAAVPGFQVFRNFRNQSVKGFSELVLLVWFTGDICKIGYHLYFRNPFQFVLCGIVQVLFDCILFYQFYKYNEGFDPNKESDEHRRLLSEDPNEYYQNYNNRYDYASASSNQFEANASHQRLLAEGKLYENAYDEAVMDPKPSIPSKSYCDEPGNVSFSSTASNNRSNHGKGKNVAITIQDENECPPENDIRPSFHNSLSSYRSYQYANIRNSNYYYLQQQQQQQQQSNNTNDNSKEENSNNNSNIKNNSSNSVNSGTGVPNTNHDIHRKNSVNTFSSYNSSTNQSDYSLSDQPDSGIRGLNHSKSVQFPRGQLRSSSTYDNHYHNNYSSLRRSNSQHNPKNPFK
jgi:hypothetical protein